ncbi:hypothetical protein LQW54_008905 [Pestalotiopsis sp. IQ-011]
MEFPPIDSLARPGEVRLKGNILQSASTVLTTKAGDQIALQLIPTSQPLPQLVLTSVVDQRTTKPKGFTELLADFKEKYPEEPKGRVEKGYSIRSKTRWEDVLRVLNDAAAVYATEAGARGALNKAKGLIEDKADLVERVSKLIPDVDYAKPILGTLTFLLVVGQGHIKNAFQQTSKVREDVKVGIEKLKKHFDAVQRYIEMYSTKQKVIDASTTLYITILKAIEDVVGHKSEALKAFNALWNGKGYEKSLLESLEKISSDGRELVDEADIAHKQTTNNIDARVEAILIEDHLKEREAQREKEKQFQRRIEEKDAEKRWWEQLYFRAVTPEPLPVLKSILSQEDILEFLDLRDIESIDLEYILYQHEMIMAGSHSRAEQIMKSTQLRTWLVQAESKELLIHGKSFPNPISPMSFFSAMLTKNLRGVDQIKSVVFFCGMHPYEDCGGARKLIMSLLTQLLQQQQFDVSFIEHHLARSLDAGNIDAFCYVFGELLRQVKSTESVFCVIDGINFYECYGEDLLQETAYVLRFLLDLTTRRGTVFKILITSPSNTEDVRQAFRDEDFFGLPEQAKDTSGFSSLKFERGLTESFED